MKCEKLKVKRFNTFHISRLTLNTSRYLIMRTIAVINQKGGVGKTTTTANLAHALVLAGYKVTAIDLDPQGHLGASFGIEPRESNGMDEVLLHEALINDFVVDVRDDFKLVPAGSGLGKLEHLAEGGAKRGALLKQALEGQFEDQDFVLIDCPPSLNLLAVNALFCTEEVLIPVNGDYLSLQGVSYLLNTFKQLEKKLNHGVKEWFVMTRYHQRRRLPEEIMGRLNHYFPKKVFQTRIRENAALAECPSYGQTIFEYRKNSNGACDYQSLADDLVCGRTI